MTVDLIRKVDHGAFQDVFIEDLNWHAPSAMPVFLTADDGRRIKATNIASYEGLTVWVCAERPGSALEAELDRLIAKTSTDRLVIFDGSDEQVWRWPVRRNRDDAVTSRLTSHRHRKGVPDPKFAARLEVIRMPFDAVLDANAVLQRVRRAFDVESQNESKHASKLMATMYAAIEKAYPARNEPSEPRSRDFGNARPNPLLDVRRRHGDVGDRRLPQRRATRNPSRRVRSRRCPQHALHLPRHRTAGERALWLRRLRVRQRRHLRRAYRAPALNREFREAILKACAVDWSTISPAIFGSMFQSVRDAETRRALGEHYTSEENILRTLNPLFLDELRD